MTSVDVTVVVATYCRSALLPRLVGALERQTLDPERFEVVIVDDASTDDTFSVLEELAARSPLRIRPFRQAVNGGPGPARNRGWRASQAPVVAFTDDDCVPEPRWLEAGLETMASDERLGIVQGCTLMPPGPHVMTDWTMFLNITSLSPYFETCNLFVRRAALEQTAGFAEQPHYRGEDTEGGWRVASAGWGVVFDETAVVRHDLEERGPRYHLRMAWREGSLVDIASRHPGLRREGLWRPWAHRRRNVAFLAAVGGVVGLRVSPWSLALVAPWVWERRGGFRRRGRTRRFLFWAIHDGAVAAGMIRGSIRNRTVIL